MSSRGDDRMPSEASQRPPQAAQHGLSCRTDDRSAAAQEGSDSVGGETRLEGDGRHEPLVGGQSGQARDEAIAHDSPSG